MTTTPSAAVHDPTAEPTGEGLGVLVTDKFEGLDGLKALGCRVEFEPDLAGEALTAAVARHDPDVLVVRGTRVEAATLQAGSALSLVVRAGAGYDTIDVTGESPTRPPTCGRAAGTRRSTPGPPASTGGRWGSSGSD
jgi:hypothetical protein